VGALSDTPGDFKLRPMEKLVASCPHG